MLERSLGCIHSHSVFQKLNIGTDIEHRQHRPKKIQKIIYYEQKLPDTGGMKVK